MLFAKFYGPDGLYVGSARVKGTDHMAKLKAGERGAVGIFVQDDTDTTSRFYVRPDEALPFGWDSLTLDQWRRWHRDKQLLRREQANWRDRKAVR